MPHIRELPEARLQALAIQFERIASELHALSDALDGYSDERGDIGGYAGTTSARSRDLGTICRRAAKESKRAA